MLKNLGIYSFDLPEAKLYKNDPKILTMMNLVSFYQNNDIVKFETILKINHSNIMDDSFLRKHSKELLQNIQTQVLIKLRFTPQYTVLLLLRS